MSRLFFFGENMKKKRKVQKKKVNTLDKYIVFSLAMIILYTIAHTVIFEFTGLEAKVLDGLFYAVFGLEILYCFLIKRFKLHDEAKIVFGKKKDTDIDEYGEENEGYE